ncbi:hypothetical protein ES703_07521 [subsurface metagenome]
MSKEEKSEEERELDEQFGIMSEERRAELRREQRKNRGNGDIDVAFDSIERLETIIKNIKKYIQTEQYKQVREIFVKLDSPVERIPIFKRLDAKIKQIYYGVSFRTTENSLIYEVNDQNFVAIYPQVNSLKIEYATPDDWKYIHLTDENEIDGAIVTIKKSCDFIRKKKK